MVEGNNKVITIQSDSVSEAEPDRATSSASAAPKIVTLSSDSGSSSDEDTSDSSSDYDPSDSSSDEDTSDSDSDEEVGSTPAKKAKVSRNESPETARVTNAPPIESSSKEERRGGKMFILEEDFAIMDAAMEQYRDVQSLKDQVQRRKEGPGQVEEEARRYH